MNNRITLWISVWITALLGVGIFVPTIVVKPFEQSTAQVLSPIIEQVELEIDEKYMEIEIPIYLSQESRIEEVPIEHYVRGVIAAEMPISFELEALKAQAIAARTYIVHRMVKQDFSNVPVDGAWVTDTIAHQAYMTDEKLREQWNDPEYEQYMSKLNLAVMETQGIIATYDNQPINATFFSTSNGYTENSEDYWSNPIPYLRSVPSPWDEDLSPRFQETISLPYTEVYQKLGMNSAQPTVGSTEAVQILEYTEGKRIKTMTISNQTFTGREVREKLGLNSSQFEWKWNDDQMEFTTYGYGHGVGMSQYGANGMAIEGKRAEEIIQYYYQGVQIERANFML